MASIVGRLRASLRVLWAGALAEHGSPWRVGLAVGVGAFLGASPLVGLQSVVALAVASAMRLNRLATLLGANISFGPLLPLVAYAEICLGARVLGRSIPTFATLRSPFDASAEVLLLWCVGFSIVGPAAAAVAGGAGYWIARSRHVAAIKRSGADADDRP